MLTPDDAAAYTRLRTAMLVDSPHAFGSSPGEGRGEDVDSILEYLSDPNKAIAVVDHPENAGEFAAAGGIMRVTTLKSRHRAGIWGVYCVPEMRGRGLGRSVMDRLIEHARSWDGVEVIGLSASAEAPEAIALYERLGFVRWGLEPDALRLGDKSFDEVYLALRL